MNIKSELYRKISRGRTFRFLPILDGHIFREFLIPFTILAMTFTLLFLVSDLFSDLSDFLENDGKVPGITKLAIEYFIIKMPGNIRFVMPISVLLSCMYTVANLGRSREITAMRASGISLLRFGGPIYLCALAVTGFNFWFNEQIVPVCDTRAAYIIEHLKDPTYEKRMLSMLQYRSPDKERDWLFMDFNPRGLHKRVILKQYFQDKAGKRQIRWDLQAASAEYQNGIGWIFHDCSVTEYLPVIHIPGNPNFYKKKIFSPKEIPENSENIRNAIKAPDMLSTKEIMTILRANPDMETLLKANYKTLIYYRLAFPWCCFLCVFLGLPLAAKNERSGIFLSIVIAVAAIVIYHMMTEVFLVLGRQGIVPPFIGGLGPTLLFIIYTYFFVIRKMS